MVNTAISLLESSMLPTVDLLSQNTMDMSRLSTLSEAATQRLGYTPNKVVVNVNPDDNSYMIEFSSNLERLMNDQVLDINEAVTAVAEANDISEYDCVVVFDESALSKICIGEIIKNEDRHYGLAQK